MRFFCSEGKNIDNLIFLGEIFQTQTLFICTVCLTSQPTPWFQPQQTYQHHVILLFKTKRKQFSGPEVRGTRPVLVTFENFKDRETVLRLAKTLKKANIHVTEDLSRRTRECRSVKNLKSICFVLKTSLIRAELRKFLRQIKKINPEKNCFLVIFDILITIT